MADGAGACDVYPEDEGGDFGGGREGDVRAEAKPSRYLPFQDFMLVGFKGGGKQDIVAYQVSDVVDDSFLPVFILRRGIYHLHRCGPRIQDKVFELVLLVSFQVAVSD